MKVLITGGTGFIGSRLVQSLDSGSIKAIGRKNVPGVREFYRKNIGRNEDYRSCFQDVDIVVHVAGLAHSRVNANTSDARAFREVNYEGTIHLAQQAAESGVKRFIFLSSISVNGSKSDSPFTETDPPNPLGVAAEIKYETEQALWGVQRESGMELVIIRSPMVYGPKAPGNFRTLVKLLKKGIPMPLGLVNNQRSLVALDNLIDLIITCINHPAAANQLFLAGDGQDLSTPEFLHAIGAAMGISARVIPVPFWLLQSGVKLFGKQQMAAQVLGTLQVDISKARVLLKWEPPISMEEGLKRCFGD
ncbi:MAG: NAD-dependent epimerase/dehydratase family protein [Neptuniibacter sp.]